ncbi:MAG TPA: class I SAM-dependent methyltransferase [Candidatus Sumerlaeota bacterium]|nr:class I SAM-dependent methyltransferase [Candidatus Sumerlaeota bacterium]
MTDWARHWIEFPLTCLPGDHLRQVGKTVGGQPISAAQVGVIADSIVGHLHLTAGDRLLDVCCGNGLLTRILADHCAAATGVDFSPPLIAVARRDHLAANIRYHLMSALALDAPTLLAEGPFSRLLVYEALQHFTPRDLDPLLDGLLALAAPRFRLLLGGIPDRRRKWRFYDTPRRRLDYLRRRLTGREAIGTWWDPATLARAAARRGLACRILPQDPRLHTAHYRFDVLIENDAAPAEAAGV